MKSKVGAVCSIALSAAAVLLSAPVQATGWEHGHGHHWRHHGHGHGFHPHHRGYVERHVYHDYGPRWREPGYVVRERRYYYAPPAPVYYEPRPAVTISVPPIVFPF